MLGLSRNKKKIKSADMNRGRKWSIGLYRGDPLEKLIEVPGNPIIASEDITDCRAGFVADPFIIKVNDIYYLFFEIMNLDSGQGDIGLAMSKDGVAWAYKGLVLREPYHLSYPWVFEWAGDYYMVPEINKARAIRLYQADDFPYSWKPVTELLTGKRYRDSSLLWNNGLWWLFTTWDDINLHLYYNDDLFGNRWQKHRASPIAKGRYARPAGRILNYKGRLFRPAQDPLPGYGSRVMLNQIQKLTIDEYKEDLIGPYFSASGSGWNSERMHHVDFLDHLPPGISQQNHGYKAEWLIVADGYNSKLTFDPIRLGIARFKRRFRNVRS
ncbi:MAG: glucosamine inositolphosphorylceramide transferase family protein [Bacillota bacterium]